MKRDPFFFASLRLLLLWVSAYVSALLCERAEAVKEESERERRGKSRTATKLFEKREVGSVKLTLFFFRSLRRVMTAQRRKRELPCFSSDFLSLSFSFFLFQRRQRELVASSLCVAPKNNTATERKRKRRLRRRHRRRRLSILFSSPSLLLRLLLLLLPLRLLCYNQRRRHHVIHGREGARLQARDGRAHLGGAGGKRERGNSVFFFLSFSSTSSLPLLSFSPPLTSSHLLSPPLLSHRLNQRKNRTSTAASASAASPSRPSTSAKTPTSCATTPDNTSAVCA